MPKHDKTHFEDYTIQNRVKHAILTKYLPAYLTALKQWINKFHYVDGFAGRGKYAGQYDGSPLLALEAIDALKLASNSSVSLVEDIDEFFDELVRHLDAHPVRQKLRYAPIVRHGQFSDFVPEILNHPIYTGASIVGTFCFVDPCGIEGVRMKDLVKFLQLPFGELLLFFNYSGFNRILGGVQAGTASGKSAAEMLGSEDRLQSLLEDLRQAPSPREREIMVRDALVAFLKHDAKAEYFVPFRFETASADRTSHYLVHCCRNDLGFKIMKSVMFRIGRDETDPYGKLELLRDDERGRQFNLFRYDLADAKHALMTRLAQGPCQVAEITDKWVRRSTDPFSPEVYKQILLDLEEAQIINVFDQSGLIPKPRKRRMRKGKPTLGDPNWVRLRN